MALFNPRRLAPILGSLADDKRLELFKLLTEGEEDGLTIESLRRELDIPVSSLYRFLGDQAEQGLSEKKSRGGYVISPWGQKVAEILTQLDDLARASRSQIAAQKLDELGYNDELIEKFREMEKMIEQRGQPSGHLNVNRNLLWAEVLEGTKMLAQEVQGQYDAELIISISGGGAIVGGMLSRHLNKPLAQVVRSNPAMEESQPDKSRLLAYPDIDRGVKRVLLVDDVVRSGYTLNEARKLSQSKNPALEIRAAALLWVVLKDEPPKASPEFYIYTSETFGLKMPWDRESRYRE